MFGDISWYNDPLFVALVVVTLSLLTTRIAARVEGRERRKERSAVLRIAFAAEIQTIVQVLEPALRDLISALKAGSPSSSHMIFLPRAVYEANVAQIGEVGDKDLVYFLVMAYSHLREYSTQGRSPEGLRNAPGESQARLASLLIGWHFAVGADSILRQTTRDTVNRRVEPCTSQEDADRLNITVDFINDLLEDSRQGGEGRSRIEQMRSQYSRAYERWTTDEDDSLRQAFSGGKNIQELAEQLGRQPSAILSRLAKLGLQ